MTLQDVRFKLRVVLPHDYRRLREKFMMMVAWRMPAWLVYFCGIRLLAHATTGQYSSTVVPELSGMDAIGRWGKDK